MLISIHSLMKRETTSDKPRSWTKSDFNPLPHEEGDFFITSFYELIFLFQSTPSWRGRQFRACAYCYHRKFQSTPSWRGRLILFYLRSVFFYISGNLSVKFSIKFQSTPSWRGRQSSYNTYQHHRLFQSTPSWRGRPSSIFAPQLGQKYFNPLPHEEGDPNGKELSISEMISIHSLMKRETWTPCISCGTCYFNPLPHEEGDTSFSSLARSFKRFQSTPSWRGRQNLCSILWLNEVFQSTPSWRGRPNLQQIATQKCRFQSTPSWRGRLLLFIACINWFYFNPLPHEEGDSHFKPSGVRR